MSEIRTLLDLQDAMSGEFAWRKRELHEIKRAVETHRNTANRDLFIRAGVTMLYAHWEGFVKQIGTQYLEFVYRQRLKNDELSSTFLALSMGRVIDEAAASRKAAIRASVVSFFREEMSKRCSLRWESIVNTRSNLSSLVFEEIIATLGLDHSPYVTKKVLIDTKLVANRNFIAHGEYLLVTLSEFLELHGQVFGMMELFFNQVEAAASKGDFLANTPRSSQ